MFFTVNRFFSVLYSVPVDIQHNQCPCRFFNFFNPRDRSYVVTSLRTPQRYYTWYNTWMLTAVLQNSAQQRKGPHLAQNHRFQHSTTYDVPGTYMIFYAILSCFVPFTFFPRTCSLSLLLGRTSDPGAITQPAGSPQLPSPHYGSCLLCFYREKNTTSSFPRRLASDSASAYPRHVCTLHRQHCHVINNTYHVDVSGQTD